MKSENAKVVTLITVFDARDLVLKAFADMNVRGYSLAHVEGVGVHGQKKSGLVETENLSYVIVASESLAAQVLDWVDRELLARYPSIAFSTDATAVTATALT